MPQNNFQIFNENNNPYTTMSDEEYASLDYRTNGLIPMIADPIAHNKMYRQWSIMAKAVANMICDKGYNALDIDVTDLKNNLKTSVKDLARDELQSDITTNANNITALQTGKADIGHTHLTADITDITATPTEINYLSGANSNIQQQINNLAISAFIPLRQDNTTYAIGDVVKVTGLSIFQYLECIATGTTGTSYTISTITGEASVDGTCIWLCCDMRDGLQAGDMKYRFTDNDLAGYIKDNRTILLLDKDNPIENVANWRLLRLFRLILNPLLYMYLHNSLFELSVFGTANLPPDLRYYPALKYGGAVILLNQWCNLTPLALTEIDYDITLQDYIDIETYKNSHFSFPNPDNIENDLKAAARYLLDGLSSEVSITVKVKNLKDYYIKLQKEKEWISRLEDEGLPNITGNLGSLVSGSNNNTNPSSGALKWGGRGTATRYQNASTTTANNWYDPAFDASSSNSIYGNSSHVTPASLHLCPFIKY